MVGDAEDITDAKLTSHSTSHFYDITLSTNEEGGNEAEKQLWVKALLPADNTYNAFEPENQGEPIPED